jgi:phytoene synthase
MNVENPETALALSYAPAESRAGVAALLALDAALAQVLRTTREPAIGQMRLVWWRDRLAALDAAAPPAEPVLQALAADLLPHGVRGAELAPLAEAWEAFALAAPLDVAALAAFADERGGRLFSLAARALGTEEARVQMAGRGWAFADLARHLDSDQLTRAARDAAGRALVVLQGKPWPRGARALGALAHLARMDLALPAGAPVPLGAPHRVARLLWHRLSGR